MLEVDQAELERIRQEWQFAATNSTDGETELVPARIEPVQKATLKVREPAKAAEIPTIPRTLSAYSAFHKEWSGVDAVKKGGVEVFGKRISTRAAKELAKAASKVLAEHFSIFEMARLLRDPRYGLDAYLETLVKIRDSAPNPKDQMAAADKIMTTILSILRANVKDEPLPETIGGGDDSTKHLMQVLVNVRSQLPDVDVTPKMLGVDEPKLPVLEGEFVEKIDKRA